MILPSGLATQARTLAAELRSSHNFERETEAGDLHRAADLLDALAARVPSLATGDHVRVVAKFPNRTSHADRGGLLWVDEMDATIGKEGVVDGIDRDGDVTVGFGNGEYWSYSPEVLEYVSA